MNNTEQMKKLMEAVDKTKAPEVDEPEVEYGNRPNEKTLDMSTVNDAGNDINRKKKAQFRSQVGDNPMAMVPVKVKAVQESLARKFKAFKKANK